MNRRPNGQGQPWSGPEPQPYTGQQQPYHAPPPPAPKKSRRRFAGYGCAVLAAMVILLIIVGVTSGTSGSGTDTSATGGTHAATAPTRAAGRTQTAEPTRAAAAPVTKTVVLRQSGSGTLNTKSFTVGADWSLSYTFDCSGFDSDGGNFQVFEDGGLDVLANAMAVTGGETTYQHADAGTHYLEINSECEWSVTVANGDDG
jgi:hypothetical protein